MHVAKAEPLSDGGPRIVFMTDSIHAQLLEAVPSVVRVRALEPAGADRANGTQPDTATGQ